MTTKPFVVAPKVMVRGPSGRYLFLRRSAASRYFAGQWEMPGGKMDPGETLEKCLVRETKEETGLDIRLGAVAVFRCRIPQIAFAVQLGCWASLWCRKGSFVDDGEPIAQWRPSWLYAVPRAGRQGHP